MPKRTHWDRETHTLRYVYRGYPCKMGGQNASHAVTGHDREIDAGGVLEWCYGRADAELMLADMRQHPRFTILRIDDCAEYE